MRSKKASHAEDIKKWSTKVVDGNFGKIRNKLAKQGFNWENINRTKREYIFMEQMLKTLAKQVQEPFCSTLAKETLKKIKNGNLD